MRLMVYGIAAVVLLALVTVGILHLSSSPDTPLDYTMEIGSEDDPYARLNFEKDLLKDPATGKIPDNILAREMEYAATVPVNSSSYKTNHWQQRGPYNIGGRTRALAFDVTNHDIMLAGGVSGGLYRSEDRGKTWEQVLGSEQLRSVTDIIQDTRPGKTDNWYYCTGEVYGNSADYPGDGIFHSDDGGKTWEGLDIANKPQEFRHLNYGWRLCLDHQRTDSTILFLASYGAILRSNDGGQNWRIMLGGEDDNLYLAGTDIMQTPKGVFYATINSRAPGQNKGILRSTDGLNWTNITPEIFPTSFGRIVMDYSAQDENLLYFLAHTPTHGKLAVHHSGRNERNSLWKFRYLGGDGRDSNARWEDLSDNIPALRQTDGFIWGDFMAQGGYNLDVVIKPNDSNWVAIAGTNIFSSTDGFTSDDNTSWIGGYLDTKDRLQAFINGLVYPNHHPDVHLMLFDPDDPDMMYSATDGGVAVTDDVNDTRVSWTSLNNGYFTTQFYTVTFNQNPNPDHAMSNLVIGGFQDNESQYIDLSKGTTDEWERIACCDGAYSHIWDDEDGTWILTSKQLGAFYLYQFDAEGNRLDAGRIDPEGGANYQFINQYVQDPFEPSRIYLPAGNFLWMNENITEIPLTDENAEVETNWHRYLRARTNDEFMISIDASSTTQGLLYVGTSGGNVYKVEAAHDPEQYTFTSLTENNALDGAGSISSVSVDPLNEDHVLVAFSNYNRKSIYVTRDGGENWRDVSGNLEENPDGSGAGTAVRVVKIVRGPQGVVYLAGTNSGLYSTTGLPGEATIWNREGADIIGVCAVRDIDYRAHDDLLFVGTHGCGSFSTKLSQIASVQNPSLAAIRAYPNPADNVVNFNFENAAEGSVQYQLFNMSGRLVMQGQMPTNGHLDVSTLANGEYVLQARSGNNMFQQMFVISH